MSHDAYSSSGRAGCFARLGKLFRVIKHYEHAYELMCSPVSEGMMRSLWARYRKYSLEGPHLELVRGPLTYNEDGLATVHDSDFTCDPRFMESYELGKQMESWGELDLRWRVYIACWLAEQALQRNGDFVECGVYRGGIPRAILHYLDFSKQDRTMYLLDTYEGLDEQYVTDEEKRLGSPLGYYEACYEQVIESFRPYDNVEIIKGAVPDTLNAVGSEIITYLHLDMNCAAPEVAAIEFFWDKIVPGGVVLLDDYGGLAYHLVQKKAMDEFAQKKKVRVLSLPTGQGLLIKA